MLKILKLGHLQEDHSMQAPVDCVVDEAQSQRVGEARERKLRELIRNFQSEPDETSADQRWKQIEKMVFGVDYPD